MPSISRTYRNTLFKAEHIQAAVALVEVLQQEWDETNPNILKTNRKMNSLSRRNETWNFDSFEEFFAEYRKGFDDSHITNITSDFRLSARAVFYEEKESQTIEISAPSRPLLERIAEIFERNAESSRIPEPEVKRFTPIIFIGHGRSPQWRDLKDHLHEQHKYEVQAYEIGARAGHTIRDILDDMLTKSSFAILVMTAEDETPEGTFRPRLNVVHELGLFQGKLGFAKAIVLLEDGTEEFSNINGIQQVRFAKGRIRETFGDILATLRREFGAG
jgi:predicted nucleotide-binding protein